MTEAEARSAFLSESPVLFDTLSTSGQQIVYKKISALIYRRKNGELNLNLELLDKSGHSVTIATPDRVTLIT